LRPSCRKRGRRKRCSGPPAARSPTPPARRFRAAKDASRQQIDELGLSKDGIQRRLGEFTDKAAGAVRSSAGAAGDAVARKGGQ
jgi:hypothetical protein